MFILKCSTLQTLYIDEEQSASEIAENYDVLVKVIAERLEECGIPARSKQEEKLIVKKNKQSRVDVDAVYYMYWDCRMSTTDIGKALGVDGSAISNVLDTARGRGGKGRLWKRRQHVRSIDRHWMVKMPEHPRADSQGYVKEVYLLWEKWYKEPFPKDRKIHYINGDYDDLGKENIRAMTNSDHSKFHAYARKREGLGMGGGGVGGKCPLEKMAGYMVEWDELQRQEEIEAQIGGFDAGYSE